MDVNSNNSNVMDWVNTHPTFVLGGLVLLGLLIVGIIRGKNQNDTNAATPTSTVGDLSGLQRDANGNPVLYRVAQDEYINTSIIEDSYNSTVDSNNTTTNNPPPTSTPPNPPPPPPPPPPPSSGPDFTSRQVLEYASAYSPNKVLHTYWKDNTDPTPHEYIDDANTGKVNGGILTLEVPGGSPGHIRYYSYRLRQQGYPDHESF